MAAVWIPQTVLYMQNAVVVIHVWTQNYATKQSRLVRHQVNAFSEVAMMVGKYAAILGVGSLMVMSGVSGYLVGGRAVSAEVDRVERGTGVIGPIHAAANDNKELHSLRKQLEEARRLRQVLEEDNRKLALLAESLGISVDNMVGIEDLSERINAFPLPVVSRYLENVFGEDTFEHIDDPRRFAKRLVELALADSPVDERGSDKVGNGTVYGDVYTELYFSTSPVMGARMLSEQSAVDVYEPVFAHVVVPDESAFGDVIVKWHNDTTGELVAFSREYVDPNRDGLAYLTATPAEGWSVGSYSISIHSFESDATFIAANQFSVGEIVGDRTAPREPNKTVMQELISSGQAWVKGE